MHGTLSFVRRDLQQCASGVPRQGFDLQARLHLQLPYYGSSEIEDQEIGSDVAEKYAGPFFDLQTLVSSVKPVSVTTFHLHIRSQM
jgi:hypothetical protein